MIAPRMSDISRISSIPGAAAVLALLCTPLVLSAQLPPPDARLVDELRRGGMVLLCRHAITDHSQQGSQRTLNAEGEAQAREIGRLLKTLGVPIADVHASPHHRNMRSAELSFGPAVADPALYPDGDARRRHALVAGLVPAGGNRAIVTHQRTIHLAVPDLRRGTIDEGVCVVVRPNAGGGYEAVAQALPADWAALVRGT
jgi:phosphohistidine phosphatase SixA